MFSALTCQLATPGKAPLKQQRKSHVQALIISGDRDMMTPVRASAALAGAIEDAKTIILGRCGHMMMIERPDETLDALIKFCVMKK